MERSRGFYRLCYPLITAPNIEEHNVNYKLLLLSKNGWYFWKPKEWVVVVFGVEREDKLRKQSSNIEAQCKTIFDSFPKGFVLNELQLNSCRKRFATIGSKGSLQVTDRFWRCLVLNYNYDLASIWPSAFESLSLPFLKMCSNT